MSTKAVGIGAVTLNFDVQGGTAISPACHTVTLNTPFGELPETTRTGYTFTGWFTQAVDGSEVTPETILETPGTPQTLYAHWTARNYTATFDSNGGTSLGIRGAKRIAFGGAYDILPMPTCTGHTFAGWYTSPTGGDLVTELSTLTTPEDHILYAHWAANALTVNFDSLGGSVPVTSSTVNFDAVYGELPEPIKPGYRFAGWYAQPTGRNEVSSATVVTDPHSPHTLYARWAPMTYTVTLDANGGTIPEAKSVTTVIFGAAYGTLPTPGYTGYIFLGWYTAPTGGRLVTDADDVAEPSDHTLYAHWMADTVTVNFDSWGGVVPTPASTTVSFHATYGTLPITSRTGYHFEGWFTAASDGNEVSPESVVSNLESPQTLFAHWSPNSLTVSFDNQGGTNVETHTATVILGETYNALPTPILAGYTFAGWYTAATDGDLVTTGSTVAIPKDHLLYARWKANVIAVSFDAQGGTTPDPALLSVLFGQAYGTLPTSSKPGYTFAGWYEQLAGKNATTAESPVTCLVGSKTLYARWTPKDYIVTLDTQGGTNTEESTTAVTFGKAYGALPLPTKPGYIFVGWYTAETSGILATETSTITTAADHTLFAYWAPKGYTVTLDARGGSGIEVPVAAVTFGNAYDALPTPVKTGYTFAGWHTTADEDGKEILATDLVTAVNDHTLYAHWTPNHYTVTFDAQGSLDTEVLTTTVVFNKDYGTLPIPTRLGHSFVEWYTAATGGDSVTSASTVTTAADHTLYAHWEPNRYTVTLDPQGEPDAKASTITATFGDTYAALPAITREHFTFKGWYTSATDGDLVTTATPVTTSANHTLYAHWSANPLTVTFDVQGGDPLGLYSARTVLFDSSYGELPLPTRIGYIFDSWYTAAAGGSSVKGTSVVAPAADHTLYARWIPRSYTVTLDTQGGSNAKDSTTTVSLGKAYGDLPAPTKPGYTFAGWFTAETNGTLVAETSTVTVMADHTLFAHWTPRSYTVTFDSQGGSEDKDSTITVTFGKTYGMLPLPSKPGHTFANWHTATLGGASITSASPVITAADHTLFAHWAPKSYTVTFNAQGGSNAKDSTGTVSFGKAYGELPAPTKPGYTFAGWFTAALGGTPITSTDPVATPENHTLYARWTPRSYTVTLDAQNSTDNKELSSTVTLGKTYGELPLPKKPGYTFAGWFSAEAQGALITEASPVTIATDHTLFAHWAPKSYTVTFDAQSGSDIEDSTGTVSFGNAYGELPAPTKPGYTFAGWFSAVAGGVSITPESSVRTAAAHTLYARWTPRSYTVTLDAQSSTDARELKTTVSYGKTYGHLPVPIKTGCTFEGWYTAADENGIKVLPTDTVTKGDDHTLYAHWTPKNYTVTFDGQGGSKIKASTITVTFGEAYDSLPVLTKVGYIFAGWHTSEAQEALITETSPVTTATDHTLFAHWAPKTCILAFDLQDGSDGKDFTGTASFGKAYGELPAPTRPGYTFAGWFSAASGGVSITSADTVTAPEDHTLYARWIPRSYTIALDAQGGSDIKESTGTVTFDKTYGKLPLPKKPGYTFAGWHTSETQETLITETSPVTTAIDHTLFAHWAPKSYTVTFDAQSGSGAKDSTGTVSFGEPYGELPTPTRPGYTFAGWFSAILGGASVTSESSVMTAAAHTLYARWTPQSYTVTLDTQGGSNAKEPTSTVTFGKAYGELPAPTKLGYTFAGWFSAKMNGALVVETSTVTATENHTLFAHWTPKNYTVTFDGQGGSKTKASTITVTFGEAYDNLPGVTKVGYTFAGWHTSEAQGALITETSTVMTATDHTLFAHWVPKSCVLTFDAQGGSDIKDSTGTVTFGNIYGKLPAPTRPGYTFAGWFTAVLDGSPVTSTDTVATPENHTLYAHWTPRSYIVTLDAQNGTDAKELTSTVTFGEAYGTLLTPIKTGYTFEGWYTAADESGIQVLPTDTGTKVDDHTLYAHWTPKSYSVIFDAQEGGSVDPTTTTVTFEQTYVLLPIPTKKNYTFVGWYTSASGGDLVRATNTVTTPVSHTLYAHWSANPLKVTFDVQGGDSLGLSGSRTVLFESPYGELPTPTKSGHTFTGWFTTSTGWTLVSGEETVTNAEDHRLYARWKANCYMVTFDTQKGTQTDPAAITVTFGDEYGVLPKTTRENYTFDGWYTAATDGMLIAALSPAATPQNHTLYAHWSPKRITVSLDAQGGNLPNGTSTKTILFDSFYGTLPTPTRTGHRFVAWSTNQDGAGTAITATSSIISANDHTLYARWSANILARETQSYAPSELFLGLDDVRRGQIRSIIFNDALPITGILYDVSAAKDKSIIAQVNGSSTLGYSVVIGATGGVLANSDSSNLFAGLTILSSLDLTHFDGSLITDSSYMFAGSALPNNLRFAAGFCSYTLNMQSMFNGAVLPSELTTFPEGFGSQARHMDNMFARATLPAGLTLPADFGTQATYLNFMFYGAVLPSGLTTFPAGFGAQAEDLSAMFYGASLSADIDWSQTTFAYLSTMSLMGAFGGTIWNGHTIKVENAATQTKFMAAILP